MRRCVSSVVCTLDDTLVDTLDDTLDDTLETLSVPFCEAGKFGTVISGTRLRSLRTRCVSVEPFPLARSLGTVSSKFLLMT